MIRPLATAALLVLLVGTPLPAAAAERVLVVDLSSPRVPAPVHGQVLAGLANTLAREGLDVRRSPADAAAGISSQINTALEEATQLARQFREQEALSRLREAEVAFRRAGSRHHLVKPLIALLLARAKVQFDTGKMAEAKETLKRVTVLDPERRLDPGQFAPPLVRSFERLRRQASKSKGRLRVTSQPAGLTVWLDGVKDDVAKTPAELQLMAGEHLVAVGPAGRIRGQLVTVPDGGEAEVHLSYAFADDNQMRAEGSKVSAEWVLGVKITGEGKRFRITLRILAARTVKVARELRSKPFAADQSTWAVSQLLLEALPLDGSGKPKVAGGGPQRPPPAKDDGDSLLRKWWFWTAIGAAVAAGGGITAAVLLTRDPGVRLRLVP